jgi:hypothetical protein
MANIEKGLQQALTAERKKRQELEAINKLLLKNWDYRELTKKDFPNPNPIVQDLANQCEHCDRSPVLNAIADEQYPNDSYQNLYEKLNAIDSDIAEIIGKEGFDFIVLGKGESYPSSGFPNFNPIAVSTEEWWAVLPRELRDWDEDEEKAEKIRDAISEFESEVVSEIETYITEKGIEDELDHYLLDDYLLKSPIFIKEIDEDELIITNQGCLGWRSDDESEWEFINNNCGSLIGRSQIVNPELLPDFLDDETIFVIQ